MVTLILFSGNGLGKSGKKGCEQVVCTFPFCIFLCLREQATPKMEVASGRVITNGKRMRANEVRLNVLSVVDGATSPPNAPASRMQKEGARKMVLRTRVSKFHCDYP